MPTDLPDYTKKIAITVTVESDQVPETAATENPITQYGRYSGGDTDYQVVVTWLVSAGKSGVLSEISVESDNYAKTLIYVMVANVAQFQDKQTRGPLTLKYADLKMAGGTQTVVMVASSDGTAITVDAVITGKEVG
jgi:hypothetical protein